MSEETGTTKQEMDPPTPDSVPTNEPSNAPRLTVVAHLYHSIPGQNTEGPSPSRFYRYLDSDEEAYTRNVKIGTEWSTLDTGWLKDKKHSCLILANTNRRVPSKRRTLQQEDADNSKVLEVGIEDIHTGMVLVFAEIAVNEDIRLSPVNIELYRIRCKTGETKYNIYLVPA